MTSAYFEISKPFRQAVEKRILRLEHHAAQDAEMISMLSGEDQRRRQRMLVDAQIDEAVRLRARLTFDEAIPTDFLRDQRFLFETPAQR